MRNKLWIWMLVLCLLLPLACAHAEEAEQPTLTMGDLSGRKDFVRREDGIPTYKPKTPQVGVAVFVVSLAEGAQSEPDLCPGVQGYLLEQTSGSLRFTDDPEEASILLYYEEWHYLADKYGPTGAIQAYSAAARLRVIPLPDDGEEAAMALARNVPGNAIYTTQDAGNYHASLPDLTMAQDMEQVTKALLALLPD